MERLVVGTTFPIFPPLGGGQSRVFHLYRELARVFEVAVVCITHDERPSDREVAPGLREIRVPMSAAHRAADNAAMAEAGGALVSDVTMPELIRLTPAYQEAFARAARGAAAVVACHPYLLPAIRAASRAPLWYEAQDVEAVLKASVLPDTPAGRALLERVRAVEQAACDEASLVLACSAEDGAELGRRYGLDPAKLVVVPNGADLSAATFTPPAERAALRRGLGIDGRVTALFMGSWHGPNIDAAEQVLRMAARRPDVAWLILGSVGGCFAGRDVPRNAGFAGAVDEDVKAAALASASCAINPMRTGSGTNLKMLDYFAAGLPVISTPFGARGLGAADGVHLTLAELDGFADAVAPSGAPDETSVRAARRLVEERFDWRGIAARLLAELEARAPGRAA